MKYIVILALISSYQLQAQVTIGWEASCDYDMNIDPNGLQQAINDGASEIRLSNQNNYVTNINILGNVVIKGGYNNCVDAANEIQNGFSSVIDGNNSAPVIIIQSINNADITFDSLELTNGLGTDIGIPSLWGGGVSIVNVKGQINFNRVYVHSNTGANGGGLSFYHFQGMPNPTSLTVNFTNSLIRQNEAARGGGVYCINFDTDHSLNLVFSQGAIVKENNATNQGGGFHLQKCQLDFVAGVSDLASANPDIEILLNTANSSGGGIFAYAGAIVNLTGTTEHKFDVFLNQSNLDTNLSASGGGIYISDVGSTANLINTHVHSNSSGRYGGGLFAIFGATINMTMGNSGCSYSDYCSKLSGNNQQSIFPGGGAAAAARFSAQINVKNTLIEFNNGDGNGYIAYLESSAGMLFEGNLIINNGQEINQSNFVAFEQSRETSLIMAYNTIENNRSNSTIFRLNFNTDLDLYGNIVNAAGNIIAQSQINSTVSIDCNMFNDISSISETTSNTVIGTAVYFDKPNHDYRLSNLSVEAIDVCDSSNYSPSLDLSNNPRGIDNPVVINVNGFYDLGAYEYLSNDVIFVNSFE